MRRGQWKVAYYFKFGVGRGGWQFPDVKKEQREIKWGVEKRAFWARLRSFYCFLFARLIIKYKTEKRSGKQQTAMPVIPLSYIILIFYKLYCQYFLLYGEISLRICCFNARVSEWTATLLISATFRRFCTITLISALTLVFYNFILFDWS